MNLMHFTQGEKLSSAFPKDLSLHLSAHPGRWREDTLEFWNILMKPRTSLMWLWVTNVNSLNLGHFNLGCEMWTIPLTHCVFPRIKLGKLFKETTENPTQSRCLKMLDLSMLKFLLYISVSVGSFIVFPLLHNSLQSSSQLVRRSRSRLLPH